MHILQNYFHTYNIQIQPFITYANQSKYHQKTPWEY